VIRIAAINAKAITGHSLQLHDYKDIRAAAGGWEKGKSAKGTSR
jgi:hypothetical protein